MTVDARAARPRRRRRRLVLAVVVVAAVAVAAAGYLVFRQRGGQAAPSPPVTTTVHLAPYQVTVSGPGSLSPLRSVALTPAVSGRVLSVPSVGDRVSRGSTLAQLDPAAFQRAVNDAELALRKAEGSLAGLQASQAKAHASLTSQIDAASADVQAAQRSYDSQRQALALTETLYAMGSASATELQGAKDAASSAADAVATARSTLVMLQRSQTLQADVDAQDLANARLAVDQAGLALSSARQDLADATVTAPFDGVVSSVDAAEGEPSGAGTPLLTLVDDSTVTLAAQIDESDVTKVALGQAATVSVDALGDRTFPGRVTAIAPTAALVSNIPIFYVTVEIDNGAHRLRGGMTGQAVIVTRTVADTFRVPTRAVTSRDGTSVVTLRQADGTYAAVPVTVLGTAGINSVLTGDVPDGAVILVSGGGAVPGNQESPRRPGAVPFGPPGGGFRNSRRSTGTRRPPP